MLREEQEGPFFMHTGIRERISVKPTDIQRTSRNYESPCSIRNVLYLALVMWLFVEMKDRYGKS